MRRFVFISLAACLLMTACKEDTIPVVSLQVLPAELVYAEDSVDLICLVGTVSCSGNPAMAPALQEYGFCINDYTYYPVELSDELQTPIERYDTFRYVLPVRYDQTLYVHAYAINPYGIIRSQTRAVIMTQLDPR